MPSVYNNPTQDIIRDLAAEKPFSEALNGWSRTFTVLSVREYAELLYSSGAEEITSFEKVYPHVLPDSDAVLEWISATAVLPYLERLPERLHERFLRDLKYRLYSLYPGSPVFFPFNRILFSARKPG